MTCFCRPAPSELLNLAKLGEGEEMQQQRDRKRRFSATSKSSLVVLSGEITNGLGGGVLFSFSLKCWAASAFSVHLCPPQPSLLHDNNLPICWKWTFPSFPSSVHCPLLPFVFSLPPTSISPSIFPHYHTPLFHCGRTPAARVLISLIGGVRMQFHLSSPLHSSTGHSITFRCSDADVAVFGCRWQRGRERGRERR